jgi:hypothetical protein
MAVMFGTSGVLFPHFLRYGFRMLKHTENRVTIELELSVNLRILRRCLGSRFFTGFSFSFYWVISFFYSANSLLFAAFDTERKTKTNNPTKMAPRMRRTNRPKTAKAKAKTKPKPTLSKKAKTVKTTEMTETKKGGRHPDDDSFWDHFGNLCKYRGRDGTMQVPRTNAGKNQPLAEWVHYSRKRKVVGLLSDHRVDA